MTRHILTTVLAGLAAVGVGAQSPTALQPGQRAELYRKNRVVIEQLVDKTVASARSPGDPIKRTESYHEVLREFSRAINQAKTDKDPARVAELTNHLNALLDRGLAPTLVSAQATVKGGTGEAEYRRARDLLLAQIDALLGNLADDSVTKKALEQTRTDLNRRIGK